MLDDVIAEAKCKAFNFGKKKSGVPIFVISDTGQLAEGETIGLAQARDGRAEILIYCSELRLVHEWWELDFVIAKSEQQE